MRWSAKWGVVSCNTCRYGMGQCSYHDTAIEGKKFCVDREYKNWQPYVPEHSDFIKESEMRV